MSARPATPLPWHYVSGAVWNTPGGIDNYGCACIAMRASNSPILPTDRDANLAYIVEAANEYPRLQDMCRAQAEQVADLMREREALRDALREMVVLIDHLHAYPRCNARRFFFLRDGGEHGSIVDARAALARSGGGK